MDVVNAAPGRWIGVPERRWSWRIGDGTLARTVLAAAFGVAVLVLVEQARNPDSTSAGFSGAVGCAYLVAGLVACQLEPDNATGRLMQWAAVGWFAEDIQLSTDPLPHTVGLLVRSVSSAVLVHLVLVFPNGVLRSRFDRLLVAAGYGAVCGLVPLSTPFTGTITPNLLLVRSLWWPTTVILVAQGVIAAGVAGVLVLRWRRASRPARRVLTPVYAAGVLGVAAALLDALLTGHGHALHLVFTRLGDAAILLLPMAFLVGVWRTQRSRGPVAELLMRLPGSSPDRLRALIADALGDPTLHVVYLRAEDGAQLDPSGRPVVAPTGQAITPVVRDGRAVAALLHDPALDTTPRLLAAVTSAVALELDNQRLTAELHARLLEIRASRARIVAAGDEQRRRIQRDLHDGAQQHLVACALTLRMARNRLAADDAHDLDDETAVLLARSADLLDTAQAQLRELARGIHPALLADAGLVPALRTLADRLPVPVRVAAAELPPLRAEVETAAYCVAAESVTNALRHAAATELRIEVELADAAAPVLRLTVTDDGVGGADPARGTGLAGLRDRLSTVDGTLLVRSPRGGGTTVVAEVPAGAR